jgi:hypothetical protein
VSFQEHFEGLFVKDHHQLLSEFDHPQEVEIACRIVFGQRMHWAVPEWIEGAVSAKWIAPADGLGPVSSLNPSRGIYPRILMLTDKGRKQLGLPIARPEQPKPKPKTLFD